MARMIDEEGRKKEGREGGEGGKDGGREEGEREGGREGGNVHSSAARVLPA